MRSSTKELVSAVLEISAVLLLTLGLFGVIALQLHQTFGTGTRRGIVLVESGATYDPSAVHAQRMSVQPLHGRVLRFQDGMTCECTPRAGM